MQAWWDRKLNSIAERYDAAHMLVVVGVSLVAAFVVTVFSEVPETWFGGYELGYAISALAFAILTGFIFHLLVVEFPQRRQRQDIVAKLAGEVAVLGVVVALMPPTITSKSSSFIRGTALTTKATLEEMAWAFPYLLPEHVEAVSEVRKAADRLLMYLEGWTPGTTSGDHLLSMFTERVSALSDKLQSEPPAPVKLMHGEVEVDVDYVREKLQPDVDDGAGPSMTP